MFLIVEQLKELIKSYTIVEALYRATGNDADKQRANDLLAQINEMRLNMAVAAEMQQIFYDQINVPIASSAVAVQNQWYSRNDQEFVLRRGIASLELETEVSLLNVADRQRAITREFVAWQQLFSGVQIVAPRGQQDVFDLPESLRFGANQALQVAVRGQNTEAGFIFWHGATIQENLEQASINELKSEFINNDGSTKYLPETQLIPLIFQFPTDDVDEPATDPNGNENIFTVKSDRSVFLLGVSSTNTDLRITQLMDLGRNQTICDNNIEMRGVASLHRNTITTYYDLPYPHLLRRGSRLRGRFINGSNITAEVVGADQNVFLTFWGVTL